MVCKQLSYVCNFISCNVCFCIAMYAYHSLYIIAPPQFIVHPMNTTVDINNESTTVVLTCAANKSLSYYWERYNSDIPNQSNIMGVKSSHLVLHNVLPSYNGRYRCVAENMYGKNYSNYATLFIKGMYNFSHV